MGILILNDLTITPGNGNTANYALPNGHVGTAYSQLFTNNGIGASTWSIDVGTLPTGLVLNPATGLLSGTPTTEGQFNFTIKAVDSLGSIGLQRFD